MKAANRVVFNTGVVYTKLVLSIFIGLFTTRLVYNALGIVDYGIYSLVAGVIAMLSFVQTAMSIASMRFITHNIGSGDIQLVKKTFNTSVLIHLLLGFFVVLLLQAGGIIMFQYLLDIPSEKYNEARIVYHFMVASTFVTVISVPFDAVIKAHEDFLAISVIDIIGLLLNLCLAVSIFYFVESSLLITYGLFILIIQVVLRVLKQSFAFFKYDECKLSLFAHTDKKLMKSILSFSGWSLISTTSTVLYVQMRGVLINMFYGVALNSSVGITQKLTAVINQVSASMTQAINPQIFKSEGARNREKMLFLTATTAKFSTFLFSIVAIPVLIETQVLFNLWLGQPPEYVVIFTRLMIFTMILEKFTFPITTAVKAVGRIQGIAIYGFVITLLIIALSYYLFSRGMPPQTIYYVSILQVIWYALSRFYWGRKLTGLSISWYLKTVILKASLPLFLSTIISLIPAYFLEPSLWRLIITTIFSVTTSVVLIRYLGLTKEEYLRIKNIAIEGFVWLKVKLGAFNQNKETRS